MRLLFPEMPYLFYFGRKLLTIAGRVLQKRAISDKLYYSIMDRKGEMYIEEGGHSDNRDRADADRLRVC